MFKPLVKILTTYIHESWFIVAFCVGIIVGMIIGLIFRINYFFSPIWIAVAIVALIVAIIKPRTALVVVAFIAGITLAFFRVSSELYGEDYIRQFYDQTVIVTGTIDGDPEHDLSGTKIKLKDLKFGDIKVPVAGSIYISAKYNKNIVRGDIITIKGKMSNGFGTYAGYFYKPTITEIKHPELGDLVLKIRNWFAGRIEKLIPTPESNLGLSYLLGMKSGLPDDLSENLRLVGLVHIVVASGAHLSILVEIARKIFGKLSRFSGLLGSILFILFFMTLVGFTPSILRAGVMSILTILTWYVGRKIAPWRIILIVASFTLILNPMFLINLGWLLSFASYAGIMILSPRITKFFYGTKKPCFFGSTIITTISATLMTLPITLYYYGMISLISLAANLLILPTLSYAMGLVFLTGVVSGIPGIEATVSFIAIKLLDFHIFIVNLFATQKSFLIEIDSYQPQVFLIYGTIIIPLAIGLIREKMVKSKQIRTNLNWENLCQDTVNGLPPNAKKPS